MRPRVPGESRNTPERSGSRTGRDARSDAGRPGGSTGSRLPFLSVRPSGRRRCAREPRLPRRSRESCQPRRCPAPAPPPRVPPPLPRPLPRPSSGPAGPPRRPRAGPDRAETRSARAAAPPRSAHLDCGPGARGPVRGARPGRPRQPAAARSALGIHVAGVYT